MTTAYDEATSALRAYYDQDADRRDADTKAGWKLEERQLFLSRLVAEGRRSLLEVGAGTGDDAQYFQQAGLVVTATDLSPRMVELCRGKGLDAHVMDFLSIAFDGRRFDALYGINCLLHVPREDLAQVLARFAELVAPGGLLYLGLYGGRDETANLEGPFGQRRFISYSDASLQAAIAAQFEVERFHRIDFAKNTFPICYQSVIARNTGKSP